jgi:hypothetical protein
MSEVGRGNLRNLIRNPKIPGLLASLVTLGLLVLTYAHYASQGRITADLSTYLLPFHARELNMGSLYVDYFDIKPPLTYAIFIPWVKVFGLSLLSMWVFYLLFLVTMFMSLWLLLRRVLTGWTALFLYCIFCVIVVGNSLLEDLFFVTEVIGLALVLLGLLVALKLTNRNYAIFLASFMMAAAGQVKEVFILAPLILFVVLMHRKTGRLAGFVSAISGILFANVVVLGILFWWGSGVPNAYLDIWKFKSDAFPKPSPSGVLSQTLDIANTVGHSWMPLFIVFLVATLSLVSASLFVKKESVRFARTSLTSESAIYFYLFFTLLLGTYWQGKGLYGHYSLPLLVAGFLVIGCLLALDLRLSATWKPGVQLGLIAVLCISLLPSVSALKWTGGRITSFNPSSFFTDLTSYENDEELKIFQRIGQLTAPEDCIQVAYGWDASAYYLYSNRKPCTRFIVPPLALSPDLQLEFRSELLKNPPPVIILDPSRRRESVERPVSGSVFEPATFPFEKVTMSCYTRDASVPIIYVSRYTSPQSLSDCIENELSE